ncbi:osmotically-inducible protein OsmY [Silvimonas terrae]|uniref:Osmotically-inducible protein OsmY n=1 Tax=Silvimonas terrae TaxID=300266 RepID=A0A840RCA4_9NEIS|nr:BON domain-containing protein [Silvimonas terrae]MBB5190158.1 osmotically-inducible protein OsmY [Silvimonas terrae]
MPIQRISMSLLIASVLGMGALAGCQKHEDTEPLAASSVASSAAMTASTPDAPVSTEQSGASDSSASAKLQDAASDVAAAASSAKDALAESSAKAGAKLDDATVTTRVKAALAKDAGLNTLALNVTTTAGVVTLSGNINSEAKHTEIKSVVSGVDGVGSIVDNTTVKGQ